MPLDDFTLGLKGEKYFPYGSGGVEAWLAPITDDLMVTVFEGNYTAIEDSAPGKWTHLVMVRTLPQHAMTREEYFGSFVNREVLFRQYTNNIDAITLKCLLLELGYLGGNQP